MPGSVAIAGSHSTACSYGPAGPRVASRRAWSGRFCRTAGSTAYPATRWVEVASLQLVPSAQDLPVDQFQEVEVPRDRLPKPRWNSCQLREEVVPSP